MAFDPITYSMLQSLKRTLNAVVLEAGVDMAIGTPVRVLNNKLYPATHTTHPHVVGVLKKAAVATFPATAAIQGVVMLSGLTPGFPYFLGDGTLSAQAPSTGYVVRLGLALTSTQLRVNVEEPIFLT